MWKLCCAFAAGVRLLTWCLPALLLYAADWVALPVMCRVSMISKAHVFCHGADVDMLDPSLRRSCCRVCRPLLMVPCPQEPDAPWSSKRHLCVAGVGVLDLAPVPASLLLLSQWSAGVNACRTYVNRKVTAQKPDS